MAIVALARILIVDDDTTSMRALCDTLRDQGFETIGCASGKEALRALQANTYDLLLTDLMMPEIDGVTLLTQAIKMDPNLVGILMTGMGTIETAVQAMKAGAFDYVLKPIQLRTLLPVLSRAVDTRNLRLANAALQENVRQRTIELETINKGLEAFVQSVSHDLRSPLMVIMGSAEQLMDDHGSFLPDVARQEVERVISCVEHMNRLINDLLRLCRIGRQPLEKQPTNMSELIHDVLKEVTENYPGRHVEVRLGELADCDGDSGLLRQVFVNLLSNAFKFTRDVSIPIVEVICQETARERVYCVRDNGAGFDMQLAKNLFGAFQRLQGSERFDGTGVGLSIVHRIIERHGGRVWAEAAVGKGASFYFALPT